MYYVILSKVSEKAHLRMLRLAAISCNCSKLQVKDLYRKVKHFFCSFSVWQYKVLVIHDIMKSYKREMNYVWNRSYWFWNVLHALFSTYFLHKIKTRIKLYGRASQKNTQNHTDFSNCRHFLNCRGSVLPHQTQVWYFAMVLAEYSSNVAS